MSFGKAAGHPKQLPVPGDALVDRDATEIFRAWIVNGGLQVSLQRGFDTPAAWGILLTDIARHAARIYATEGICSEAEALSQIKSLFDAEWNRPTDPGRTGAARQ
jgi:Domain of unknown function (DUF5076)